MKKLPKDKRNQLWGVAAITAVLLAALWFTVVKTQKRNLANLARIKAEAQHKFDQIKLTIKSGPRIEAELAETTRALTECETGMASGDLYSWAINTIRQFKAPYRIDIPQFSPIDGPKDMNMLPQFPYKQATLTIGGTGYFHDLGRFIADLENQFPYLRISGLSLEPAPGSNAAEREKLSFRMDLAALVKPTS